MRILPAVPVLIAAFGLLSPAPASAQLASPETNPLTPPGCCQALMDQAQAMLVEGNWRAARKAYMRAADDQIAAGEFPGYALWEAAEIEHGRRSPLRAARHLDRIATYAERFGRPTMQVRALTEAGNIYHQLGRNALAYERYLRIQALLSSPDVSDDARRLAADRFPSPVAMQTAN